MRERCMKRWQVTISNSEYETYLVDAETAQEADNKMEAAMNDGSLWDGNRKDIEAFGGGRGDSWQVEPGMTELVPMAYVERN